MYSCYLRKGTVYIPTWGKVETGSHRMVEPVSIVPVSDTEGLRRSLRDAFARGNPIVPNLLREQQRQPPLLQKYAGVKDWSTFARSTLTWNIVEKGGTYTITRKMRSPHGGWIPDPSHVVTMPPGATVDDVIDPTIAILQETVRNHTDDKTHGSPRAKS